MSPVAAPGTPRLGRSSGSTQSAQNLFAVNWLFIYFEDNVATREIDVLGERTRLHVLHDYSFAGRNIEPVSHVRSYLSHGHTKLARLGRILILVALILAQALSKEFGTICNGHRSVLRFPISQEP